MTAGKLDLVIEQGATFQRALVWKDAAETPINLTGYTARMQIREYLVDEEPLISLTSGSGITITAAQGKLDVEISAAATAALSITKGFYDLEVESASGVVTRLLQGKVTVEGNVTR